MATPRKGAEVVTTKETGGVRRPSAPAGTSVRVRGTNVAGEVEGTFTDMWGKTHKTRLSRDEY
jgi:hypothetical protein